MKKKLFLLIFVLLSLCGYSQNIYSSRNGTNISPMAKMRMLNLFINIIYDQTPGRDPQKKEEKNPWQAGIVNTVNSNVPYFLKDFMDPDFTGSPLKSIISGFFYESSLGNFICLGDFVFVDVAQSRITPNKPGSSFSQVDIIRQAIRIINETGGLRTVFGHDSISDYDNFSTGTSGLPKPLIPNGKIDFLQVVFRNTGRILENGNMIASYGNNNAGEGNASEGSLGKDCRIKMGNKFYDNDMYSFQNIGWNNFLYPEKGISIHEFSHLLLGGNEFHTSGGNHYGTATAGPFMGLQGGWGMMGGANSSLISCNGYERWRLGWIDSVQNPRHYPVSANGNNSDISNDQGEQTFVLRDFVTTSDVIRIKFPYIDKGASNQYLWLENHQVGKNGKMDFMQYSNTDECRDKGSAGIYAYIQVGRDVLESKNYSDVFVASETDNLKVVSAKGNWDRKLESLYDTVKCIAWGAVERSESIDKPNPLSGYMDQQTHFFDITGNTKKFTDQSSCDYPWIIFQNGTQYSNLPYLGDNLDAFTNGSVMNIGSNPAPVNTVTFYVTQGNGYYKAFQKINTRHVFLTGLSIQMNEQKDGTYLVHIRWDDYTVKNNIRWTGNIILKEQLKLENGKTLTLDQNYTPNQLTRDSLSGVFAPLTTLTAESSGRIELFSKSKIIIENGSSLILEPSSQLILNKSSQIILKDNSELIIKKGAELILKGGKIINKGRGKFINDNN